MTNPKILNLDELELPQSEISIVHKGKSYSMRVLTVEMFIAQQKRAAAHEKMVAEGKFSEDEGDVADIVTLIRDAILEFFPELPVNELETAKLFSIFAWLNEISSKINEANAPEPDSEDGEEGNVEEATES